MLLIKAYSPYATDQIEEGFLRYASFMHEIYLPGSKATWMGEEG